VDLRGLYLHAEVEVAASERRKCGYFEGSISSCRF
jgi:hypothetical protein